MLRSASIAILLLTGCDGVSTLSCGPGTHREGDVCVADAPGTMPGSDAGMPGPSTDAGSYSTTGPGMPLAPGCDARGGECAAWADAIARELGAGRGCATPLSRDPAVERVAARHADHQAATDRLTASSPDGSLFDQVRREGVSFREAGALFSMTRDGPEDVLARWRENRDAAPLMEVCWTDVGVGVSTSESGATYVSVILVSR